MAYDPLLPLTTPPLSLPGFRSKLSRDDSVFEVGRELEGKPTAFLSAEAEPTLNKIGAVGTAVEDVPGVVVAAVAGGNTEIGAGVTPVSCTVGWAETATGTSHSSSPRNGRVRRVMALSFLSRWQLWDAWQQ